MKSSRAEAITAEIVRNYLETVSAEMSKVVENTSISPIFSETHDYSTGIFYLDERGVSLVARAQSVPVHIFAALTSVMIVPTTLGARCRSATCVPTEVCPSSR